MKIHYIFCLLFLFHLTSSAVVKGQIAFNDDCNGAIFLSDVSEYCSEINEYTNTGASASAQPTPGCFVQGESHDVWFAFRASNTGVSVRIVGATDFFTGGTLEQPQAALYQGPCDNLTLLDCDADDENNQNGDFTHVSALQHTDLQVGETYFIRVDGQVGSTGDFQLCITSFDPVPEPNSDCEPGVLLCDKSSFIVPFLSSNGNVTNEVTGPPCGGDNCNYGELQSAWYKWICKDPGTLTFSLNPLNPVDDLDFWIYELPNGVDDCTGKIPLLCMASGMITGQAVNTWIRCHGPTGLRAGETDDHENCGCDSGDNNYIMPLQMEAGKAYALVVMNFSSTGDGFTINFGGTGTFLGPQVDFDIDPVLDNQCDIDTILITDQSESGIGNIINYEWNFGRGATPATGNTEGPHEIYYSSFGTKNIVLRITSDAGCTVTEIRSIFIEPCCDPLNDLAVDIVDQGDPLCPGTSSGFFEVEGRGGSPEYLFSTNGVDFLPLTQFNGLAPGMYDIWIQDIKGCVDSNMVTINEPPPFSVEAGPDQTIELGTQTALNASIFPDPFGSSFSWRQDTSLSCLDCLDPEVFPPFTTTYHITATNVFGCMDTDSVTVFVQVVRPVYIPSGFSPNNDGINDYFTVYTGPQARLIQRLLIFDRWGNLVYEGKNLLPNAEAMGWDGTFKGKEMNPAVFAYYVEVLFIDDVVVPFEGDITLLR